MSVNVRSGFRSGLILLAVTIGSVTAVRAQEPQFRARDIKGSYGYSCSGVVVESDVLPVGPFAQVGQVSCDGVQTCEGTATGSFAGLILPVALTGTYTVNPNGTGSALYDLTVAGQPAGQLPIDFVITEKGRGIKGLPTTSGFAITCDLKTQKGPQD